MNIEKIYQLFIDGTILTSQNLSQLGITFEELTDFEESGKLVKIGSNEYTVASVEELFQYGEKLLKQREREKANTCFLKCYEMDHAHKGVCFRLFHNSAYRKDYEKALEYFESLYENENRMICRKDNNVYLFLLNEFLELPNTLAEKAKSLGLEDILFDEKEFCFYNKELQNRIRTLVFEHRIEEVFNGIPSKADSCLTLIKILCNQILNEKQNSIESEEEKIFRFLRKREYYALIVYLEGKDILNTQEEYILKLAKILLEIRNTKLIPEKRLGITDDLFMAIDMKDYEQALVIIESQEINFYNNSIRLLLKEIILRITDLKQNMSEIEGFIPARDELVAEVQIEELPNLSYIFESLRKGKVEQAIECFHLYLKRLGKEQYTFLIDNLIKIGLLEQDILFTKAVVGLIRISQEKFMFDISSYAESFYSTLLSGNFEQAMLYLNIILKAKMDDTFRIEEILKQDFEVLKNYTSENTEEQNLQTQPKTLIEDSSAKNKEILVGSSETVNAETVRTSRKSEITVEQINQLEIYIKQKLEELKQTRGIILLEPMNNVERKEIHQYVENLPYVKSFSIGEGINRRIVLRYIDMNMTYLDFREEFECSATAYYQRDYTTCIAINLDLLSCEAFKPRAKTYATLGLCYTKLHLKKQAIDFLTVASEYNRLEPNGKNDFTELIGQLKGWISEGERKPFVKVDIKEFESSSKNIADDLNLEIISKMVSERGLSIDEACLELGMNLVEANLVKLEYARFNYMESQDKIGDKLLKAVEKSQYKDKRVLSLLESIKKNKSLYKRKSIVDTPQYVLRIPSNKIF